MSLAMSPSAFGARQLLRHRGLDRGADRLTQRRYELGDGVDEIGAGQEFEIVVVGAVDYNQALGTAGRLEHFLALIDRSDRVGRAGDYQQGNLE